MWPEKNSRQRPQCSSLARLIFGMGQAMSATMLLYPGLLEDPAGGATAALTLRRQWGNGLVDPVSNTQEVTT
jgi:hypothetical protein